MPVNPVIESLDIRDLDLKDAIKLIAQKSGLNIVTSEAVQGRVTVYLENIPARDALAAVLEMAHAACEENAGVIQVVTDQDYQMKHGRPFSQRASTRLFYLKGARASMAAGLLERIKNQFGRVVPDDVSGTVYVEDTPLKLAEMERYLRDIDRPLQTRVISLGYLQGETVAAKISGMLTPGLGSVRTDRQSNKVFVTDVPEKVLGIEAYLRDVDVSRTPVVVDVSYGKAEEIGGILRQYLTPDFGSVEVNKRANQIIVADTKSRVEEIIAIIRQLDRKEQEVLIEAKIVQVYLRDEFRMGIDWDVIVKNAHGLELKSQWGGVGSDYKGSIAIGTLSDDNYRAVIEALGSINKSHVLSSPRVAVLNNEEAKILVGTTKPYVTTQTTTPGSGPVTTAEDIKFIDVGVKLLVTPTIHPDGYVTMKIRPEVSSAANFITTGQNNVIPIVDTSEVETTIRVRDGVTVVLGGLIKDEKSGTTSKVPLLGDIPLLGGAFRNSGRNKEKTEIVIFLTPRIITGDLK